MILPKIILKIRYDSSKSCRVTYRWHTNNIRITYVCIRVICGWHTSTYEWHMGDIRVHTNDIRMAYEYTRATYRWHTSTNERHINDMQVHTSNIQMTCDWHSDDLWFERKIKLTFLKLFDNSLSNFWIDENCLNVCPSSSTSQYFEERRWNHQGKLNKENGNWVHLILELVNYSLLG